MMPSMTDLGDIRIRLARGDEVPRLPEIERESSGRFDGIEALAGVSPDPTPVAALQDALTHANVWVAVTPRDDVVGFAYACVIDRCLHLEEVDVLPAQGRRGIGSALIRTVCARARALNSRRSP